MNIEEKVMMLKELRKQHKHYLNEVMLNKNLSTILNKKDCEIMLLIEEKIEQILKTI